MPVNHKGHVHPTILRIPHYTCIECLDGWVEIMNTQKRKNKTFSPEECIQKDDLWNLSSENCLIDLDFTVSQAHIAPCNRQAAFFIFIYFWNSTNRLKWDCIILAAFSGTTMGRKSKEKNVVFDSIAPRRNSMPLKSFFSFTYAERKRTESWRTAFI